MDRQIFKTSVLKPIKPLKAGQVANRVYSTVSSSSTRFNRMETNNKSKKIENDIQIKRSFPNSKNFDHWFETEEEIETEEQCNKIGNQNNSQKRKNSFSKTSSSKVRDISSMFSSTKQKPKLTFFHCDTIAIRPNPQNLDIKIEEQPLEEKIEEQKGYESPSKQFKRIFVSDISICNKTINEESSNRRGQAQGYEEISSVRHLKPSSMKKHKRIFQHIKKQAECELPFALRTQENEKQRRIRQIFQSNDDFHIIIDTDQITQCCF